jgi:hypothetical protein
LIQSAFTKILPEEVDFAERMCIMNVVKIFMVLHVDLSEDTHVVTIIFISNNNNKRIVDFWNVMPCSLISGAVLQKNALPPSSG